jgi:ABC-type sugar transport system substrate-binding protein
MTSSKISGGIAAAALLVGFAGAARADDVKLGYINKMGDHPWFVASVSSAKTIVSPCASCGGNLDHLRFLY